VDTLVWMLLYTHSIDALVWILWCVDAAGLAAVVWLQRCGCCGTKDVVWMLLCGVALWMLCCNALMWMM